MQQVLNTGLEILLDNRSKQGPFPSLEIMQSKAVQNPVYLDDAEVSHMEGSYSSRLKPTKKVC